MPLLPPLLERPVEHLRARLADPAAPRRWLVALAGLPGSGKSTRAARWAAEVNAAVGGTAMIALGMDGFHLTKAQLRARPNAEAALARRGAPWTFDAGPLARRLAALRRAAEREPVAWPDFQHALGDPVEGVHIVAPGVRIVLVEGLYLGHRADGWAGVRAAFDEHWYLDTPWETALARLLARHRTAWGLTDAEARRRIAANDALNARIVLAARAGADWRVP